MRCSPALRVRLAVLLSLLLGWSFGLHAQGPAGTGDETFRAPPGALGVGVTTARASSDNGVLIGLRPLNVAGAPAYRETVIRLLPDGSEDSGFSRAVQAAFPRDLNDLRLLAAYADGRALVLSRGPGGGALLRLGPDGVPEAGFLVQFPFQDLATTAVVLPDGGALVSRQFVEPLPDGRTKISSTLRRLRANGSADEGFRPAVNPGVGSTVLLASSDGKVLVYDGSVPVRLNVDGSVDRNFAAANGIGYAAAPFARQSGDDKLLIGRVFYETSAFGGPPVRQSDIVRLNPDGSLDPTFQYRPDPEQAHGPLFYGPPLRALVQMDGKILVGRNAFAGSGGVDTLFRLRPDGSPDFSFRAAQLGGFFSAPAFVSASSVRNLALTDDDRVIFGGSGSSFSLYNSTSTENGFAGRLLRDFSPKRADLTVKLINVSGYVLPLGEVVTRYPLRAVVRLTNQGNKSVRGATLSAYVSDRADYNLDPSPFHAGADLSLVPLPIVAGYDANGTLVSLKLRYSPGTAAVALNLPKLASGTQLDLPLKWNLSPADAETLTGKSLVLVITPPENLAEADATNNVAEFHALP